jgi:hypothetical protein
MIKAKHVGRAQALLRGEKVQRALLSLFEIGGECRLDDFGVMHREAGELPTKEHTLEVLDRLVEVANAIRNRPE